MPGGVELNRDSEAYLIKPRLRNSEHPGMVFLYIKRAIVIVAAALSCVWLAEQYGTTTASLIWAGLMALACGIGTVLLRTSRVSQVTWRNRLAGYLIPWGWRLNRGLLWPIPVISWIVWMAIGAAAMLLRPGSESLALRLALFTAWVVDASVVVFLLGTLQQSTAGSRAGSVWKLFVLVVSLPVVSIGLYIGGLAPAALAVGGGPPLVAGVVFGLFTLVLLTLGRNARWN
jgi:hypothetical protein